MKKFLLITTILSLLVLVILILSMVGRIMFFKAPANEENAASKIEPLQVNILNATNIDGIAAQTRIFLRSREIDVVEISNFASMEANSLIIDRVGDRQSAKKLADEIGMSDSLIVTQIDSSLFLKCSLILGYDYKKYLPFRSKEQNRSLY